MPRRIDGSRIYKKNIDDNSRLELVADGGFGFFMNADNRPTLPPPCYWTAILRLNLESMLEIRDKQTSIPRA